MGLCGAGQYALPSPAFVPLYIESDHRGCVCRYKACRYCGKTVSAGGLVYILPSGEVYHGKQDCSSLAYYVQKVRRSEVEYMGVCSYCGSG